VLDTASNLASYVPEWTKPAPHLKRLGNDAPAVARVDRTGNISPLGPINDASVRDCPL